MVSNCLRRYAVLTIAGMVSVSGKVHSATPLPERESGSLRRIYRLMLAHTACVQ